MTTLSLIGATLGVAALLYMAAASVGAARRSTGTTRWVSVATVVSFTFCAVVLALAGLGVL